MSTQTRHRGYTLIELIVSVAIFSIVMLVAGAAFLALISLDRKARATNDVVTNLSYVVDSMERSVRTGTNYSSASDTDQFSFTDANGRVIAYRLNQGQVEQSMAGGAYIGLTDPRVSIQTLKFYPRGTLAGDSIQPTVIITIRGTLKPDAQSAPVEFVIESAATQRLIDI